MGALFGGRDRSAQEAQISQNRTAQDVIERQTRLGRQDLLSFLPQAIGGQRAGAEAALNLLTGQGGQTGAIQEALGTFQQGNIQAQNTLADAEGAFASAILGGPSPSRAQVSPLFDVGASLRGVALPQQTFGSVETPTQVRVPRPAIPQPVVRQPPASQFAAFPQVNPLAFLGGGGITRSFIDPSGFNLR